MLDQPAEVIRNEHGFVCRRCGYVWLQRYDLDHLPESPNQAMTLGMYLGAAMVCHLRDAHKTEA